MSSFPDSFLWGTATAAHQVEGNNTNSDFWAMEFAPHDIPGAERGCLRPLSAVPR